MDYEHTIIHTGALGDLCLALVFARRSHWLCPARGVDVIATNSLGRLQYDGATAVVRHWDTLAAHRLFAGDEADIPPELVARLQNRRVLSFLGCERAAAILRHQPRELISINPVAQPEVSQHILGQWLSQTPLEPAEDWLTRPTLESRLRTASDERRLLIHTGSGGAKKCWPLANFRTLIEMLSAEYHLTLTLGPVELEQWPATRRQELERLAEVRTPDLVGLAQLVRDSDLLISNDSGPAHLAALLGTPTLTLFGPTRAATWRPIGAAAQVIQGEAALGDDWGIKAEAVHAAATAIVNGLSFPLHPDV